MFGFAAFGVAAFAALPEEPVSQNAISTMEWRAPVSQTGSTPLEALQGLSASGTALLEVLGRLAAAQLAGHEWLHPLLVTQLARLEYRGALAQSVSTPVEVLGRVPGLGTITRVGVGVMAVSITDGAPITAEYPVGYTAVEGDFAVVLLAGRPLGTVQPTVPTGYTQRNTQFGDLVGMNDVRITGLYRVLQAGDAAPAFTVPTAWAGAFGGMSVQMAVYRGVDPSTPFDVADAIAEAAAAATWQPPGLTTVTARAYVLSLVATPDANALTFAAGLSQGFAEAMGGGAYDITLGGDHSVALGDKEIVSLGAVTMPTWQETVGGLDDSWVGITLALRPGPAVGTPSVIEWVQGLIASRQMPVEFLGRLAVAGLSPAEWVNPLAVSGTALVEWLGRIAASQGLPTEWMQYVASLGVIPLEWQSPAGVVTQSQLIVLEWRGPASALETALLEWLSPVAAAGSVPSDWRMPVLVTGVLPTEWLQSLTAVRAVPVEWRSPLATQHILLAEWLGRLVRSGTIPLEWRGPVILVFPRLALVLDSSGITVLLDPSDIMADLDPSGSGGALD